MTVSRSDIEQWARALRISRRRRRDIAIELQSHLLESQQELERAGWRTEDAERESLLRLGDPTEIVEGFEQVYRTPRKKQFALAVALATGMLLGAYGLGGSLASAKPSVSHSSTHILIQRTIRAEHRVQVWSRSRAAAPR